jgi:hypothetical protein
MQNLSAAEVTALTTDLDGLKSKDLPDYTKSLLLGLKLTNMVSTEVLGAAKRSLGDSILCAKEHDAAQTNGAHGVKERAEIATAVVDRDSDSTFASKDMPQTPSTPDPPE